MARSETDFRIDRLPKDLQETFAKIYSVESPDDRATLTPDAVYQGNAVDLLRLIEPTALR